VYCPFPPPGLFPPKGGAGGFSRGVFPPFWGPPPPPLYNPKSRRWRNLQLALGGFVEPGLRACPRAMLAATGPPASTCLIPSGSPRKLEFLAVLRTADIAVSRPKERPAPARHALQAFDRAGSRSGNRGGAKPSPQLIRRRAPSLAGITRRNDREAGSGPGQDQPGLSHGLASIAAIPRSNGWNGFRLGLTSAPP